MRKCSLFWSAVFLFAASLTLSTVAVAKKGKASRSQKGDYTVEKRSDGTTVKYKNKETYDFEGLGVDGVYDKPSGSYISNIKDVKAKSLIQIRKNFDPEVSDSARHMP